MCTSFKWHILTLLVLVSYFYIYEAGSGRTLNVVRAFTPAPPPSVNFYFNQQIEKGVSY